MNKKTVRVLVAYVAGQVTQIVIHAMCLSNNLYSYRQIPFCVAGGFVILFAVLSGVWIANNREEKPEHEKTYLEHSEIPEKKTVIDPFKVVEEVKKKKEAVQ